MSETAEKPESPAINWVHSHEHAVRAVAEELAKQNPEKSDVDNWYEACNRLLAPGVQWKGYVSDRLFFTITYTLTGNYVVVTPDYISNNAMTFNQAVEPCKKYWRKVLLLDPKDAPDSLMHGLIDQIIPE